MTSDPRALIGALRNSHERLDGLVRTLTPDQLRAPSYDTDWTIAQVLSHLGSGAEIATLSLAAALGGRGQLDQGAFPAIWDAWNNRTPEMQAADCLTWDGEHIRRLEALSDEELASIGLDFFGRQLDAAALVRLRLSEHAIHVWDVAVSADPGATVASDAILPAMEQITQLFQFVAKPAGDAFRVRLRTTAPDGDYLLDVGESVTLSDWAEGSASDGSASDGSASDGSASDGSASDGSVADGSVADGSVADGSVADGEITLPAEALLRLFYGRLDPEHTPEYSAEGIELDRLRAVFPGF